MENIKEAIEHVYQMGKEERNLKAVPIRSQSEEALAALVPRNLEVVDLSAYVPERPRRKEIERRFYELSSFTGYVNEQKSEYSRIFATLREAPYEFVAILDYHGTAGAPADWCGHRATLELTLSENFENWKKIDGMMMNQALFAEFLKDNRLDISSPDNAEILSLVMDLEAAANSRVVGKQPTNSGMAFSFQEEVSASVGGSRVTIPDQLVLRMPIFDGMGEEEIVCDFKFRIKDGNLMFGIRMIGVDRMIRLAVMAARERIADQVKLPVYL